MELVSEAEKVPIGFCFVAAGKFDSRRHAASELQKYLDYLFVHLHVTVLHLRNRG